MATVVAWFCRLLGFVLMGWAYVLEPDVGGRINEGLTAKFADAEGRIVVAPRLVLSQFLAVGILVLLEYGGPFAKQHVYLAVVLAITLVIDVMFLLVSLLPVTTHWRRGVLALIAKGVCAFVATARSRHTAGPLGALGFLLVISGYLIDNPWF